MSASGRFAACLAASLLAHGVVLWVSPRSEPALGVAAPLVVVLRPAEPEPVGPSSASEQRTGGVHRRSFPTTAPLRENTLLTQAALPVAVQVPVAAPALAQEEPRMEVARSSPPPGPPNTPLPEPSAEPSPMADAAPAESLNSWRPQHRNDAVLQATHALAQEAERLRYEAQLRGMAIASMWMGMQQRLSVLRPEQAGDCLLQRPSGFLPECQGPSLGEWSERLRLQEWAAKLGELDGSVQELRLSAVQGRLHLQVLMPGPSAPTHTAVRQHGAQDAHR